MCEDCTLAVCPAACPYASYEARRTCCVICGEPIFDGDAHVCYEGKTLCPSCAESLSQDDLVTLCGLQSNEELLSLLGFAFFR